MKLLLLGANGQLGWQLRRSLCVLGDVTALGRSDPTWCGDLSNPEGLAATVRGLRPDVIVNAGAYTAVDRAETEPAAAFAINAQACETLASEAARLGAWLVHYSTEYVFDGSGDRPWAEADATAPLNVYGQSKLAGEQAIARLCERHLILRCSWLFDTPGANFLKTILQAAQKRPALEVVDDEWGAPTRAALVADVTSHLLRSLQPQQAGTYHVAASGETSRHAYATFLLDCARRHGLATVAGAQDVRAVPTVPGARPARRPANSRMDTGRLRQAFGLAMPPWQRGVEAVVAEIAKAAGP